MPPPPPPPLMLSPPLPLSPLSSPSSLSYPVTHNLSTSPSSAKFRIDTVHCTNNNDFRPAGDFNQFCAIFSFNVDADAV